MSPDISKALVLFAALSLSFPAFSEEETIKWKDVNGWRIAVDTTVGNGCFMSTLFEGGTVLRFGFTKNPNGGYISVGNLNWSSLEEGKTYKISIRMDDEPAWNASATATKIGIPTLVVKTHEVDFVTELATKHGLRITFNGREVVRLSLKGSYAAVQAIVECQGKVNEAMTAGDRYRKSKDPFSDGGSVMNADDPFAQ
ncbi:MAG: hypothetical protein K0S56_914 [Microvirga sp.]|jgi:hypothetical protein|nr:hypothetical protein [Microvirga sp.]